MVIFETVLDENSAKMLSKVSLKKMLIILLLISLVFFILGILNFLLKNNSMGIFWLIVGILYIPLVLLLVSSSQKKQNKSMSLLSDETHQTFTFYEDHIEIKQVKGDEFDSLVKAKYSYLFKVCEVKEAFILYISTVQAHVIFKKDLVEGTIEELKGILTEQFGPNFQQLK